MAVYIETMVFEALCARLEGLTFSPVLPILWPERPMTLPSDNKFLRVSDMPDATRNLSLANGSQEYSGLFQIDVCWPMGFGQTAPLEISGAIINQFAPGTTFVRQSASVLVRQCWRSGFVDDHPRVFLPVSVRYQVFA